MNRLLTLAMIRFMSRIMARVMTSSERPSWYLV